MVEPDQGVISSSPGFEEGSDFAFHHAARDRTFTLQKSPYRIIPMKQIDDYQNLQHNQTFEIGGFLGEVEASDRAYESYYNCENTFIVLPFEDLVHKFTADQTSLRPMELCYGFTVRSTTNFAPAKDRRTV